VEVEENGKVDCESVIDETGRATRVPKKFKAGGLFSPVIATLITGFVRAYLHRLEHQYQSIHSSTDSIKTFAKLEVDSLPHGLGGLNVEVKGDCILLRNKLYLHYDGAMVLGGKPAKYALHGFWGSVDELLAMVAGRRIHYEVEHLYRMKEANKQGKTPLKSYLQEREVYIDWQAYTEMASGEAQGKSGPASIPKEIWLPRESLGRLEEGRRVQARLQAPI
jgi:hypothetical protein